MIKASALLGLYVASVLFFASSSVRGRTRVAWFEPRARRWLARGAAFGAISAAWWGWHGIEAGPAAGFVVVVGMMAASTLVAVLGALTPRSVWASAWIATAALAILIVLGTAS